MGESVPRKAKKTEEQPQPDVAMEAPAPEEAEAPATPDWEAEEQEVDGEQAQAVTFQLDGQLYGLPIEVVQEIQQLVEFTPLPDVDPSLIGLVDIRGLVVPAIDLRVLVGMPRRDYTLETPMIFCRVRGHVVCLIVDAVEDVVTLPPGGLQEPSKLYSMADKMLGMVRLPQGLVLLLDIDRLVPDVTLTAADVQGGF